MQWKRASDTYADGSCVTNHVRAICSSYTDV